MPWVEAAPNAHEADHAGQRLLALGPGLSVQIGYDPYWTTATLGPPNLSMATFPALIDTGAAESCIDIEFAQTLGLSIADVRTIAGVSGLMNVNMYLAHVHAPYLHFTSWGLFAGVDLSGGGQIHKALLGRTFLARFMMIYDGPRAQVTLIR